jgi:hypothetical protein
MKELTLKQKLELIEKMRKQLIKNEKKNDDAYLCGIFERFFLKESETYFLNEFMHRVFPELLKAIETSVLLNIWN